MVLVKFSIVKGYIGSYSITFMSQGSYSEGLLFTA